MRRAAVGEIYRKQPARCTAGRVSLENAILTSENSSEISVAQLIKQQPRWRTDIPALESINSRHFGCRLPRSFQHTSISYAHLGKEDCRVSSYIQSICIRSMWIIFNVPEFIGLHQMDIRKFMKYNEVHTCWSISFIRSAGGGSFFAGFYLKWKSPTRFRSTQSLQLSSSSS